MLFSIKFNKKIISFKIILSIKNNNKILKTLKLNKNKYKNKLKANKFN